MRPLDPGPHDELVDQHMVTAVDGAEKKSGFAVGAGSNLTTASSVSRAEIEWAASGGRADAGPIVDADPATPQPAAGRTTASPLIAEALPTVRPPSDSAPLRHDKRAECVVSDAGRRSRRPPQHREGGGGRGLRRKALQRALRNRGSRQPLLDRGRTHRRAICLPDQPSSAEQRRHLGPTG